MPAENFAEQQRMMQRLDRESQEQLQRVREMVIEAGRTDIVEYLDRRLRENALGITGARSTWHSISDAQRTLLAHLVERTGNMRLAIHGSGALTYHVDPPGVPLPKPARLSTVRALAARGLLDWDGGAFNPEWAAVANERARFVLKHGRPAPGEHFEGYRP